MGTAEIAAMIATGALLFNVFTNLFNGGWNMSSRLTKSESTMTAIAQRLESVEQGQKRIGDLLERLADMKTEQKLVEQRMLFLEEDIRLLRVGEGYIKNPRAQTVEREYGGG